MPKYLIIFDTFDRGRPIPLSQRKTLIRNTLAIRRREGLLCEPVGVEEKVGYASSHNHGAPSTISRHGTYVASVGVTPVASRYDRTTRYPIPYPI